MTGGGYPRHSARPAALPDLRKLGRCALAAERAAAVARHHRPPLRGLGWPNPFFDARTKAPLSAPRVLTPSERAAL